MIQIIDPDQQITTKKVYSDSEANYTEIFLVEKTGQWTVKSVFRGDSTYYGSSAETMIQVNETNEGIPVKTIITEIIVVTIVLLMIKRVLK